MARPRDPMGLEFILAKDDDQDKDTTSVAKTPKLAALISSATPSPVVKNIYFAKVARDWYDVLCIKSRSYEVKEIEGDSNFNNLNSIAWRQDIDGLILSSLVFPRLEHDDDPIPQSVPAGETASERKERKERQKKEQQKKDREQKDKRYKLPPQMLVLALQRISLKSELQRNLIFTFGYTDSLGNVQFVIRRYPLQVIGNNTLGFSMAVDPKARVLAVCAQTGGFVLYKLRDWATIRAAVEKGSTIDHNAFEPVDNDSREIHLEDRTTIWQMEFVPSPENEPDIAYLLVHIENADGRSISVYRIDTTQPLAGQRIEASRQRIELGYPIEACGLEGRLLIIPLYYIPGIILYAEKQLTVIADVRKPDAAPQVHPIDDENERVDDPGFFRSDSMYTAWARPPRRKKWAKEKHIDVVYLCREDGQVKLLEVEISSNGRARSSSTRLGHIPSIVDKAFAVVTPLLSEHDMLITGGSHSNGALVSIMASDHPQLETIIPSSGPVIDFALVPSSANDVGQRSRVFATTNRGRRHGAISEIRHGHEVRVFEPVDLKDKDADINKIWLLPIQDIPYLYTITTTGTRDVYRFVEARDADFSEHRDPAKPSLWKHEEGNRWSNAPDKGESIIAMSLLKSGHYLRVTTTSIQQFDDQQEWTTIDIVDLNSSNIVIAFIDSFISCVLFVTSNQDRYEIQLLQHESDQWHKKNPCRIEKEPSCIYSSIVKSFYLTVIGFQDGTLVFYSLDDAGLIEIGHHDLGGADGVCESVVLLQRQTGGAGSQFRVSLLCGLRSGQVKLFDIDKTDNAIHLKERDTISIETTGVQIVPQFKHIDEQEDAYKNGIATTSASTGKNEKVAKIKNASKHDGTTSTAILYSQTSLYSFTDDGRGFSQTNLKRLWFVNPRGKGICQPIIRSIAVLPPWLLYGKLNSNDVICLMESGTSTKICRCRLQTTEKPHNIPWQIHVGGNPCRVIWSNHHKVLFVGVMIQVAEDADKIKNNKIHRFAAIKIIDPNDPNLMSIKIEEENTSTVLQSVFDPKDFATLVGNSGNEITSIAEWRTDVQGTKRDMVLVSTTGIKEGGKGRVWLYRYSGKKLDLKHYHTEKATIRGVTAYDESSCIVVTETELVQLEIRKEEDQLKLRERVRTAINATISRHLSVENGQVRIGTIGHALQIYEIREQSFELILSDNGGAHSYAATTVSLPQPTPTSIQHEGRAHLTVQVKRPVGLGHTDCEITCHYQPATTPASGQLTKLFGTNLPTQLTALEQASLRPALQIDQNIDKNLLPYPRILASAVNGAFYNIDLVPFNLWRILHISQVLIEWDGRLTPFLPADAHYAKRLAALFKSGLRPEERNVNGDILKRLFELPIEEQLGFVRSLIEKKDDNGETGEGEITKALVELLGRNRVKEGVDIAETLLQVLEVVDAP